MESGLYIDGGTFNTCLAYDFSFLLLVLPLFLSAVARYMPGHCIYLLQLTRLNTHLRPPGASHLRKSDHMLYIAIVISFVFM